MRRLLPPLIGLGALVVSLLLLFLLLPKGAEYLPGPLPPGGNGEGGDRRREAPSSRRIEFDPVGPAESKSEGEGFLPARAADPAPLWGDPPPAGGGAGGEGDAPVRGGSGPGESPFLDEDHLGPEIAVAFQLRYGRLEEERPLPQTLGVPYFWRPVLLEEGYRQDGEPRNVLKLPFPGPPPHFVIWERREPCLAESPFGRNRRVLSVGEKSEAVNAVLLPRCDAEGAPGVPFLYEFAVRTMDFVVWGGERRDLVAEPGRLRLRLRSNTYLEGRLEDQDIYLCDDNANGVFGDEPSGAGASASNDALWPDCDTVTIGRGESARCSYFGGLFRSESRFYLRSGWNPETWTLMVREYRGPLGTLRLRFGGRRASPLRHLVLGIDTVRSATGFVDVAEEGRPLRIPPGRYILQWGLVRPRPALDRLGHVQIFRGTHPGIEIEAGSSADLRLAESVTARIPVRVDPSGRTATIETGKMEVRGLEGELYRKPWGRTLGGAFRVYDEANEEVFEGVLRPLEREGPFLPQEGLVNALMVPEPVTFPLSSGREHRPPYRLRFLWRDLLLGAVRSP